MTCNTPFCNCSCCVASCKKSRTTLCFSQRCVTSCLRVTSPQQLATQFCQNGPIGAHLSLAGDFRHLVCYCTRCQLRKKVVNLWHPLCNLKGISFVIVALQAAREVASCNIIILLPVYVYSLTLKVRAVNILVNGYIPLIFCSLFSAGVRSAWYCRCHYKLCFDWLGG